jgi:hypothetical protein
MMAAKQIGNVDFEKLVPSLCTISGRWICSRSVNKKHHRRTPHHRAGGGGGSVFFKQSLFKIFGRPGASFSKVHICHFVVQPALYPYMVTVPDVPQGRCVHSNSTDIRDNDWTCATFDAKLMLTVLRLASKIKPMSDITDIVMLAAEIALKPDELGAFTDRIESGIIRLPGTRTVRRGKQRMDIMAMHWVAQLYKEHDVTAYDIIDSSPQGGWNFLIIRTDEFLFPKDASPLARIQTNLASIFHRRTMPVTCLGYGRGGLVDKLANYVHCGHLETQDLERWPGIVVGCLAKCSSHHMNSTFLYELVRRFAISYCMSARIFEAIT